MVTRVGFAGLAAVLVLLAADLAEATYHFAVIDEMMTSYGGDPTVQFVEIRMLFPGQNLVGDSVLATFDATGAYIGDVLVLPSDVPNDGSNVRWLMGTAQFAVVSGITPDFTISASLPTGGGMVCWGAPNPQLTGPPPPGSWNHMNAGLYTDCVAYGTYSGPTNFNIGAPTPLTGEGHSLQRTSSTRDNFTDFICGDPSTPTTNVPTSATLAGTSPCPACGNGVREGIEECDGSDAAACPGECWSSCRCPCAPQPETCIAEVLPQTGPLTVKSNVDPAKNLFVWKWLKSATTVSLGDPTTSTNFAFCLYDQSGPTPPTLLLSARSPAGGTCGANLCWKSIAPGFKYLDKDGTPDGVLKLEIHGGVYPHSKIVMKGKGTNLSLASFMQLTQPVTAQLRSSDGPCWTATYSAPAIKNADGLFKDKND